MASRAQPARWFTGQFLPVGKGEESRLAMHYAKLVRGARQGQAFKFADKPICQCGASVAKGVTPLHITTQAKALVGTWNGCSPVTKPARNQRAFPT